MGSRVATEEADAAAAALLTLQELAAAARRMERVRVVPMEVEAPAARPPHPRPRPPPSRVQRLVAALRGRYSRGVDAVLYGFIGAVWVALVAGCVPMAVSRWVGVHGHAVAVVGGAVSWVSVRAMGVLAPAFVPLFVLRGMDRGRAQVVEVRDELENSNVARENPPTDGINPENNGAWRQLAKQANSVAKVICIVFFLVILTGLLIKQLAPVKRSELWAGGSILVEIGFCVCSALSSMIILPKLVFEMRRMGVL
uniref:Uncharacterized protein n=1 Tax=Oryza meridionalis TaxID=40149 RepID=A0A0E0ELI9_9ORYZ